MLVQWVKHELNSKGVPPIIFIDEAHIGSVENEWGATAEALAEAGANIVLLTGTPYRTDHRRIYGFDFDEIESRPVRILRSQQDASGQYAVDIYEGVKTILRLRPDYEMSLQQAWDLDYLCKINHLPYDIDLTSYDLMTDEQTGRNWLSNLPPSRLSGKLADILRDEKVVRSFCEHLVMALSQRKQDFPEAAAIVYVGNDKEVEDRDNEHALRVVEALEAISNFQCMIATSKSEGDADKTLKEFSDGKGDVLVVKQMGGVGLDVPRIKVCLDLSVVRAANLYVQRVLRIGTIYRRSADPADVIMTADYISPADILGTALWQNFIADQHGETTLTNTEYVQTVQGREGEKQGHFEYHKPGDVVITDYSDTQGQTSPAESLDTVQKVINVLKPIERSMTKPDIEKALPALREALASELAPMTSPPVSPITTAVRSTNDDYKVAQSELNSLARMVSEGRLGRKYNPKDPGFGDMMKRVWWDHKSACGFPEKKPKDYTEAEVVALNQSLSEELDLYD